MADRNRRPHRHGTTGPGCLTRGGSGYRGVHHLPGRDATDRWNELERSDLGGFLRLINEARTKAGKQPLPFLNPLIYPVMSSGSFRDITTGSNGAFNAGIGYDLVTGIGVPDLKALTEELKSK